MPLKVYKLMWENKKKEIVYLMTVSNSFFDAVPNPSLTRMDNVKAIVKGVNESNVYILKETKGGEVVVQPITKLSTNNMNYVSEILGQYANTIMTTSKIQLKHFLKTKLQGHINAFEEHIKSTEKRRNSPNRLYTTRYYDNQIKEYENKIKNVYAYYSKVCALIKKS